MMTPEPPAAGRPVYRLLLRREPGTPWALQRLRRLLKMMLRVHGYRCVGLAEMPPAAAQDGAGDAAAFGGGPGAGGAAGAG
jgi:hypothetical protein